MIPTSSEAAPALGKDDLGIDQHCQDARLIADCKFGDLHEVQRQLEIKYCACLASGRGNGFPISVDRIHDPKLRALAGAGMVCRGWSVADLYACTGDLKDTAAVVIEVARFHPVWGMQDFIDFERIEALEAEWRRLEP